MNAASTQSARSSLALLAMLWFTTPAAATAKETVVTVSQNIIDGQHPTDLADEVMGAFGLIGKWVWEPALKMEVERHLNGLLGHNWSVKREAGAVVVYGTPLANPPRNGLKHEMALKFIDHADHVTIKQWQRRAGHTVFTVNHYYGWDGSLSHLLRVERPLRRGDGRAVVHNRRRHTSNPGWRPWKGKVKREFSPPHL